MAAYLGRSQKWSKEGVFKVRKHRGYSPERHFVIILVKITKKIGPMGGGSDPPIFPPPLATPLMVTVEW